MLVESEELAALVGVELAAEENAGRWSVAVELLVADELCWRFLSDELLFGLANGEGVGLREEVGHQLIVVVDWIIDNRVRLLRLRKADKLNRSDSALMQQLEEAMLAIGSRLSEVDHSSRIRDDFSLRVHSFSVALHIELLDVRGELAKGLAVRNNRTRCVTLHCSSVEPDKPQKERDVFLHNYTSTSIDSSLSSNLSMECPPDRNSLAVSKPK